MGCLSYRLYWRRDTRSRDFPTYGMAIAWAFDHLDEPWCVDANASCS